MGKGDIRTRRGKIWRRTYGVTRPRRWKSVPRPAATSRKVKTLKDLPKAVAEEQVKKIVVEAVKPVHQELAATHTPVAVEVARPVVIEAAPVQVAAKTVVKKASKPAPTKKIPTAKKAPVAKKQVAKKAPAKKKK